MNSLTRVFLVFLRLAIGWHFLVEGIDKIHSVNLGPTQTNRPWTSEPYLREASGPLGDFFRHQAGDPEEAALARLTPVPPIQGDADLGLRYTSFPPELGKDWDEYYDRFIRFYTDPDPLTMDSLPPEQRAQPNAPEILDEINQDRQKRIAASDPERLKAEADARLKQQKEVTVRWLTEGRKKVKKTYPSGIVEVEQTTPQRVAEYREQWDKVRAMQNEKLPAFGQDVLKDQLRSAKAELARLRNDLLKDLAVQTEEMKKGLRDVLPSTLKELGPVPDRLVLRPGGVIGKVTPDAVFYCWDWAGHARRIDWIDLVTRYGLAAVGTCLLLGLFTRTACLGGAVFLLLFYLTMPPFPGVPENLRAEGHYLFVNKNLIEMLALLTLATTRSGRWAGLDGIVYSLNPWRWRKSRRARQVRIERGAAPYSPRS
jgi:uncharacterized membrane protein YphA (DoxX/SURF4 family)